MIWFFYGKDGTKVREEARKTSLGLAQKMGVDEVKIGDANFDKEFILGLARGDGLFEPVKVVRLENIGEQNEGKEFYGEFVETLESSQTVFIVAEVAPLKEIRELISKASKKKFEVEDNSQSNWDDSKVARDSVFSFSTAFGERNKKKLWLLFNDFLSKGMASEELVHNLFWQAKMIKMAYKCKTASEAGLKDFVFSKAKVYSKNYTEDEIDSILERIIVVYQEGHKGEDIDKLLEEFILGL